MENDNKEIEVVSGDGEDLNISPVYTHLPICKPKSNKNKDEKIVIPEEKKKEKRIARK